MRLVILDEGSINVNDLSWAPIEAIGKLKIYETTEPDEIVEHIGNAEGVFVNKCKLSREIMEACPNIKFISITATGYDNVDTVAAKDLGIAVCNVPAYSTEAVAQHTIALLLYLTNHVAAHNEAIQRGEWYTSKDFAFLVKPLTLLEGKSLGIIGYGNIGKRVADIAEALGMKVNIYSRNKEAAIQSDFLSLHCPATPENAGFINKEFIGSMKDGAVLINTARGALINEADLAEALKSGKLAAAALDVISKEPPTEPHPLIGLDNCILTPHISWMPRETRQKLIEISAKNLQSFIDGKNLNRID